MCWTQRSLNIFDRFFVSFANRIQKLEGIRLFEFERTPAVAAARVQGRICFDSPHAKSSVSPH